MNKGDCQCGCGYIWADWEKLGSVGSASSVGIRLDETCHTLRLAARHFEQENKQLKAQLARIRSVVNGG